MVEGASHKDQGYMFLEEGMASPDGTSFGLGAARRGWCGPRVERTGGEQAQEAGSGQIVGPRDHSQSSAFILRERESHGCLLGQCEILV